MVSTAAPQSTVRLSDYRPYPFRIPAIDLNVVVGDALVTVTAAFQVEPMDAVASTAMQLRGVDLELVSIAIDDQPLPQGAYALTGDGLVIRTHPRNRSNSPQSVASTPRPTPPWKGCT